MAAWSSLGRGDTVLCPPGLIHTLCSAAMNGNGFLGLSGTQAVRVSRGCDSKKSSWAVGCMHVIFTHNVKQWLTFPQFASLHSSQQ